MWFHRVLRGDSGALVDPFMHVGTYPTRHLATLRESELLRRLQPLAQLNPDFRYLYWPGFRSPFTPLSRLRLPVFLLNSRDPFVTATCSDNTRLKEQAPLIPKVRG